MLKTIIKFNNLAKELISSGGVRVAEIRSSPVVYRISRMKDIPNEEFEDRIKTLWMDMETTLVAGKGWTQ